MTESNQKQTLSSKDDLTSKPTKIRRLNDDIDCSTTKTNDIEVETIQESSDENQECTKNNDSDNNDTTHMNHNDTTTKDTTTIDAKTFLFRSPATTKEINAMTKKMKSQIDFAHSVLSNHGYEAFQRMKRKRYHHYFMDFGNDENGRRKRYTINENGVVVDENGVVVNFSGDYDNGDLDDDVNHNGMDTDDEMNEAMRDQEKLAMLQEAVVKGNPRRYQVALVELAKRQNTIVNLGTGQGKTLIALLLIKHFASAYQEGKQTLFIVPSIALAGQHTTTLLANLPYTVATACHSSTRSTANKEKLAQANILVATHGAAKDLFMHYGDLFSFERINLLIVDECHYCSGEHGYTTLMKNFYHKVSVEKRPRVLGLTASPLVNVKIDIDDERLGQMLDNLESVMDCQLACLSRIGVANSKGEISHRTGFVKKEAEERSILYQDPNPHEVPMLPSYENKGLHPTRFKELNQVSQLYFQLGPKVTSIYSATVARELSRNRFEEETHEEFIRMTDTLMEISKFCADLCKNDPTGGRTEKLAVLEQLLEDIIESKGAENAVGVVFVDRRITALALYDYFRHRHKMIEKGDWIRVKDTKFNRLPHEDPKNVISLETLVNSKKKQGAFDITTSRFQDAPFDITDVDNSIIFDVLKETLPDGIDLEKLIKNTNDNQNVESKLAPMKENDVQARKISCDMVVRQCTQVFKYLDKSHHYEENTKVEWLHESKRIKDVLDGLRTKKTNVLIATSVVEEGVDVEACAFVISFDNIKSTKAYVQMKGRARAHNAKFFVFQNVTPGNQNPFLNLQNAQATDRRVKQYIETREKYFLRLVDPQPKFLHETIDLPTLAAEDVAVRSGSYRTSLAFVDIASAKALLNRYTLSIPIDSTNRHKKDLLGLHLPQFEEDRLLLPAHLPIAARCVILPDRFKGCSKKEKQGIMSLIACVRLHQLHLLNDRLLPLKRKDMQNKLLGVALRELFSSGEAPSHRSPPLPGESNKVFIYKLTQSGVLFDQNDKAVGGNKRSLCFISLSPFINNIPDFCFQHVELDEVRCQILELHQQIITHEEWNLSAQFHTAIMNTRWRKRSKSLFYRYSNEKVQKGIIPPYVIGCLNENDEIDWSRMRLILKEFSRSFEERKQAVLQSPINEDLPLPRVWIPIYDQFASYISYGSSSLSCNAKFPDQRDEVKTYADYFTNVRDFKVENDSRLFVVQRMWYQPRRMLFKKESKRAPLFDVWKKRLKTDLDLDDNDYDIYEGERSPCDGLVTALLPVSACVEASVADASLHLHCILLPQVMYQLEQLLTAKLFVEHCKLHLPIFGKLIESISKESIDDILEALIAKSCTLDRNYDKLEWLGDGVLKLIHTESLVHSNDLRKWVSFLHEGDLTLLRSAMGSNLRLTNATKSAGFDRFILFKQLGRGQWIPIGMELHEIDSDGNEIVSKVNDVQPGKKTSADLMESLLGLIYLHKGFQAAFDVAQELGLTLPCDREYESLVSNYHPKEALVKFSKEYFGGLTMKHPELLEEAVNHPTCIHESMPSYQKLEWIGDAVLCLFMREWVYKTFKELEVGEMVILEATAVCNETLAYICVKNGLQRYLNHCDSSLPSKIAEFEQSMKGRGLWATDPPKTLPDIVEAMFGAAYIDSGFEAGQHAVATVMQPILDALLSSLASRNSNDMRGKAHAMMHPKQYVHEVAGGVLSVKAWNEEDFVIRRRNCPVWKDGKWIKCEGVGNNSIGLIESFGLDLIGIEESSSHVARNRACSIAMQIFEANPDLAAKLKSFIQLLNPQKPIQNDNSSSQLEKSSETQ